MAKDFMKVRSGINFIPQGSAPVSPQNGDLYYDSGSDAFQFYQDGAWTGLGAGGSSEISFTGANNQTNANVTGLAFANASVGAFTAIVRVVLDATSDKYEVVTLTGVQRASDWAMSAVTAGDDSGVEFSITNAGQVQYNSPNSAGFVSLTMKIKTETVSV
jgi:hypothetical protein